MNLTDAHCHLTYEPFADIEAVLKQSRDAGVTSWITIGTDLADSQKAIELTGRFENMFAAVAIHPHNAKSADPQTVTQIKELAQNKKVVAIGETGLDLHYDFSTPQQQQNSFNKHLEIAKELNLPVVIHSREAFDETMEILEEHESGLKSLVFHCYSGDVGQAKIILDKGWYISLTGVVTFKNAETTREVAKYVPLDRLMIETDAPYLSPEPMRKQKINEPALLVHTARFVAGLRGMKLAKFIDAVATTTTQFFHC
jgi:TatD DNase family protein